MGFVGSRCTSCETGHLPPQRVCVKCAAVDQMRDERFADTSCKVTTYTLDHLAYSLQPPVVAAIVDFDGVSRGGLPSIAQRGQRARRRAAFDLYPPTIL